MTRLSMIIATLALAALAACGDASDDQSATTTEASTTTEALTTTTTDAPITELERDLSYGPDERHRLDVLYREGMAGAPTILVIHGGGWNSGDKAGEHVLAKYFVEHGFVVVVPNYRLVNDDGTENAFPVPVEDVACAAAWLDQHAADFGGDPSTMLVTGYSAGGHLAAMLAVNSERDWLEDCSIGDIDLAFDGLIGFAGPYDFGVHPPGTAPVCNLLAGLIPEGTACSEADPALWAEANPVDLVTPDDPPALLVTGDQDCKVSMPDPDTGRCTGSADAFGGALADAGVAVETLVIPGGGHGDVGIDLPPIAWSVADFLHRHGFAAEPPVGPPTEPGFEPADALDAVLPGVWFTSSSHPMVLQADGSWSLLAKIVKLPWTWGTWTLDGDLLTLTTGDDAHLLCEGTTGTYRVAVSADGGQIHFTLVDDPCRARAMELSGGPYEWIPDSLVPGDLK